MRYVIVNAEGRIINAVVAGKDWAPPEGCTAEPSGDYDIGGTLVKGGYTAPPAPPAPEPPPRPDEVHAAYLEAALSRMGELSAVKAGLAGDPVRLALFNRASSFRRGEPDLEAGARALGVDLDEVFRVAKEIAASRGMQA